MDLRPTLEEYHSSVWNDHNRALERTDVLNFLSMACLALYLKGFDMTSNSIWKKPKIMLPSQVAQHFALYCRVVWSSSVFKCGQVKSSQVQYLSHSLNMNVKIYVVKHVNK